MAFIKFYIKNNSGELKRFPTITSKSLPTICWDLPEGVNQISFCLELKSRHMVKLSSGLMGYAYYSSGIVMSNASQHQISLEMLADVWAGPIEVRLRTFDENGKTIFSTHPESSTEYPFEPVRQGYSWFSIYDGYYFLFDHNVEYISDTTSPTFQWRNVFDVDTSQQLSYQLQWSTTPLFNEGYFFRTGEEIHGEEFQYAKDGLRTTTTSEILISSSIFYRIRAFDGLDYGEWSIVNGFLYSPSARPICHFNFIETNCTTEESNQQIRPNGEILISFRVKDVDSKIVSAYLSYKVNGEETPLSLDSSLVMIGTNEDINVVWPSARQIINKLQTVTIRIYASDGENKSDIVQYEYPVIVNNIGIGYGTGDIGGDDFNYRICSNAKEQEKWIQIPDKKAITIVTSEDISYDPNRLPDSPPGTSLIEPWSWGEYWHSKLGSNYDQHKFWIGENYDQKERSTIKRSYFALYNGYNDYESSSSQLLLKYRDEFEATKKDGESFSKYLSENIEKCKEWCRNQNPPIQYDENQIDLGKTIDNVTFFLKDSSYGKSTRIRAPKIVRADTSGLYYDGMAIENKMDEIFESTDTESPEPEYPDGVDELKKKELWRFFYKVDRMYDPNFSGSKDSQTSFTIIGPNIPKRMDSQNHWYWQLFEYSIEIDFPLVINDQNKNFSYVYNGKTFIGSLVDEEEKRIEYSGRFTHELEELMLKVFSNDIFQKISSEDVEFDEKNKRCRINIFSLQKDSNKNFQFIGVENNCYELLKIDLGKRMSKRTKFSYEGNFVLKQLGEKPKDKIEFDLPADSGKWIGDNDVLDSSEPLFTCDKDHVNSNGCHFKYTPERYSLYKKIFIRKYRVVPVFNEKSNEALRSPEDGETSVPVKNYCNFTIEKAGVNELGDVLYKKIYSKSIGGLPALTRYIDVEFENEIVKDKGWWLSSSDINDNSQCLSHEWNQEKSIFKRRSPQSFVKKIGFAPCFTAEYVDADEAWEKPLIDQSQGGSKLNRCQPIFNEGEIPVGYIQYLLGAYEPPTDARKIALTEEQISKGIEAEDLTQKEEISEYDSKFVSSVYPTNDQTLMYQRYESNWKNAWSSDAFEKLRTVVDPSLFEIGSYEWSIMKYGYQPDTTINKYFKEDKDGIWKDRVIPISSNYVHKIYSAESGEESMSSNLAQVYHNVIIKDRMLISDHSKIKISDEDGTKAEYLDYPVKASAPREEKRYFSSLPTEESEEYLNRPIGVYGEDRPTRISGYIDSLSQLMPWRFIYLHTSWNTYNLVHWEGNQDENIYAKIEVANVSNGETGAFMTLHSKTSEWFERFKCWLIPFEKLRQSMYIDTLNGEFLYINDLGIKTYNNFEDGRTYRFRISGVNINSGASTSTVMSEVFTYSRTAYSPPIILNTEYNKWTGQFKIEFRFDDYLGRRYDITDVSYAVYDRYEQSPPESSYEKLEIQNIIGDTIDLESNTLGDNVVNESYIIRHKIFIPSGSISLSDLEGKYIRFRLNAVPSEDRAGLTLPVFNFRMWANELLRAADKTISSIAGHANQWVLEDSYDDQGNYHQVWRYLPIAEAVYVPGKIEEQNKIISEVESKFESWYVESAVKFDMKGFDAKHSYLLSTVQGDGDLYLSLTEDFISMIRPPDEMHNTEWSLSSEWEGFLKENEGKTKRHLAPLFISKMNETKNFNFYWDNFGALKISIDESKFNSWWKSHCVIEENEGRKIFTQSEKHNQEYLNFLNERHLEDSDDSRRLFIAENNLTQEFDYFLRVLNNYHDSRYDQKRDFIENGHHSDFIEWKSNPKNGYGDESKIYNLTEDQYFKEDKKYYIHDGEKYVEANVVQGEEILESEYFEMNFCNDDLYTLFIASKKELWASFSPINNGKSEARSYFISQTKNGITYGQQLQTAYENISLYSSKLNDAYKIRLKYENEHRKRLIMQGYFSNGWKNNEAYTLNGEKNDVFRFRVVNKASTGKVNKKKESGITTDTIIPVAGYDTRWEVYFHWQMDFYDSFDSQNGRPLRDYLYMRADLLGYSGSDSETWMRIQGAIEADSGGMSVLPGDTYTPTDENSKIHSPTTDDPYSYQLAGRFAIIKTDLPGYGQYDPFTGERTKDTLPRHWSKGDIRPEDDWNQTYFWRVCPYNLVKRPLMEKECSEIISLSKMSSNFYLIECNNKMFGDHSYDFLSMDGQMDEYKFIWISTSRLNNPIWKKDSQSKCFNSREGNFSSFFNGTDENRMDISPELNSAKESYIQRMKNGEMVFLTDRPKELSDGKLSYIEDQIENFHSPWVPFQSKREKIWVMKDNEECCWYSVSHKTIRESNGKNENSIILSKGLSQNSWGDAYQVLPYSTLDKPSSLVQNATSFENPCILSVEEYHLVLSGDNGSSKIFLKGFGYSKDSIGDFEIVNDEFIDGLIEIDGSDIDISRFNISGVTDLKFVRLYRKKTWHIYFNAIFNSSKEIYRTSSNDLLSWSLPEKIFVPQNNTDPAVYFDNGSWKMLTVSGRSIKKYSSSDGLSWVFDSTVFSEQYTLERPSFANGRIYFGLKVTFAMNLKTYGKIYSIDENGEYDSLRIEKGNQIEDLNDSTMPTEGDVWFTPFVFIDNDKGVNVLRMCYMTEDNIYAYSNHSIVKTELKEDHWFTEYLEEYEWTRNVLNKMYDIDYSYWSSMVTVDGKEYPIVSDKDLVKVNLSYENKYIPTGHLNIIFKSEEEPIAVKLPFFVDNGFKDIRSEGEWIDFYNVKDTEAWLHPEDEDEEYDPSDYGLERYLIENELYIQYISWLNEQHPEEPSSEKMMTEFLLLTKRYSLYLKWSKKGPGIYRYLFSVRQSKYWGSGD